MGLPGSTDASSERSTTRRTSSATCQRTWRNAPTGTMKIQESAAPKKSVTESCSKLSRTNATSPCCRVSRPQQQSHLLISRHCIIIHIIWFDTLYSRQINERYVQSEFAK